MLISGFAYWSLVLDHRPHPPGRMIVGLRVLSPAITMTPQIVAGAIVTFSKADLYPIFEICGRAFTFNVLTGQLIGGVITWVPAALLESMGGLMAMRQWLRLSRSGRLPRKPCTPSAIRPGLMRSSGQDCVSVEVTLAAGLAPWSIGGMVWSSPSSTALAGRARKSVASVLPSANLRFNLTVSPGFTSLFAFINIK